MITTQQPFVESKRGRNTYLPREKEREVNLGRVRVLAPTQPHICPLEGVEMLSLTALLLEPTPIRRSLHTYPDLKGMMTRTFAFFAELEIE